MLTALPTTTKPENGARQIGKQQRQEAEVDAGANIFI